MTAPGSFLDALVSSQRTPELVDADDILVWMPEAEEPGFGRFVAFMRNQARSRRLF
jgi:hypothetical protein